MKIVTLNENFMNEGCYNVPFHYVWTVEVTIIVQRLDDIGFECQFAMIFPLRWWTKVMSTKLILWSLSISEVNFNLPSLSMSLVEVTYSGGVVVIISSTYFFKKAGLKLSSGIRQI